MFRFIVTECIEPLYFENFDLENIITPVDPVAFERLLVKSKYDPKKTEFIVKGFSEGFDLGYEGPSNIQLRSKNLKFKGVGNEVILWNKVMKEVSLGRYAGPFREIPYDNFIQSPIGLVPKDGGADVCLIFHLSHPRSEVGKSVNSNIPERLCSVKYPDFNDAIRLCLATGKGCKLAKSDFRLAFRNAPLRRGVWRWLILKAVSPFDGIEYFFVDKCLPFEAAISCAIFQVISDAIAHVVKSRTHKDLINYLDDFLFVAMLRRWCNEQVEIFMEICADIRFPISEEKTYWVADCLVFQGFLVDPDQQIIAVSAEKIPKGVTIIESILSAKKGKVTLKQIERLCGFLNFLGRAIVPGRAFTRRLYSYINKKLKPHHHIRLKADGKEDLRMWLSFLQHPSVYNRSFMDFTKTWSADEISMFSDASKNPLLGCGATCMDSWSYMQWNKSFIVKNDPSIEYLELYGVLVAVLNWLHRFRNKRIVLFCDNQSVVYMINNMTSSCKQCLVLIRLLVLHSLKLNVRVFAKHLSSKANKNSDLLSRLKIQEFLKQKKSWDKFPTPIPEAIWPMTKLWVNH